jgi:hypothetical protein
MSSQNSLVLMSLLSPGDVDALLGAENGNEGGRNIKLPGGEFVECVLFKKLDAHPFPVPMIVVSAAARADWKLGSAVIAFVAAAMA